MRLHLHTGCRRYRRRCWRRGGLQDQYDVEAGQLFKGMSDRAEGFGAVVRQIGRAHEKGTSPPCALDISAISVSSVDTTQRSTCCGVTRGGERQAISGRPARSRTFLRRQALGSAACRHHCQYPQAVDQPNISANSALARSRSSMRPMSTQ